MICLERTLNETRKDKTAWQTFIIAQVNIW
jgi:hypothetical protein